MNTCRLLVIMLVIGAPLHRAGAATESVVSNTSKRQVMLELAEKLLAPRPDPSASLPATLVNPFIPGATRKAGVTQFAGSDHEILARIILRIPSTGMMTFADHPILLLGEKRLKVGDSLTIPFEGTDYVVVITDITSASFKVRYNREEITRPIKSGKAP